MMLPTIPLGFVAAHFICDWLLQSNWMALNKGKWWDTCIGLRALTIHSIIATSWCWIFGWEFGLMNLIFHWVIDGFTSQATSWFWFIDLRKCSSRVFTGTGPITEYEYLANINQSKRHWFFVAIGFDQLIHYTTIAYLWEVR